MVFHALPTVHPCQVLSVSTAACLLTVTVTNTLLQVTFPVATHVLTDHALWALSALGSAHYICIDLASAFPR